MTREALRLTGPARSFHARCLNEHAAFLYASRGRAPEAKALLGEMVEAVGSPQAYAAAIGLLARMGDDEEAERVRAARSGGSPG